MNPYEKGFRDGHLDKLTGYQSRYSWYGVDYDAPGTYSHEYSHGYRKGWTQGRRWEL